MFANKHDLKNNIYNYQIDQITEGDDTIIFEALSIAEQTVRSYLVFNDQKKYLDGRPHYNTEEIFSATNTQRNPVILNLVTTIAKWHIIELSNVDIIYDQAKERYQYALDYLQKIASGEVTLFDLPIITDIDKKQKNTLPFRMGSRKKFNHSEE